MGFLMQKFSAMANKISGGFTNSFMRRFKTIMCET